MVLRGLICCCVDVVLAVAILLLDTWRKEAARFIKGFEEGADCRFFCKDKCESCLRDLAAGFLVTGLLVAPLWGDEADDEDDEEEEEETDDFFGGIAADSTILPPTQLTLGILM